MSQSDDYTTTQFLYTKLKCIVLLTGLLSDKNDFTIEIVLTLLALGRVLRYTTSRSSRSEFDLSYWTPGDILSTNNQRRLTISANSSDLDHVNHSVDFIDTVSSYYQGLTSHYDEGLTSLIVYFASLDQILKTLAVWGTFLKSHVPTLQCSATYLLMVPTDLEHDKCHVWGTCLTSFWSNLQCSVLDLLHNGPQDSELMMISRMIGKYELNLCKILVSSILCDIITRRGLKLLVNGQRFLIINVLFKILVSSGILAEKTKNVDHEVVLRNLNEDDVVQGFCDSFRFVLYFSIPSILYILSIWAVPASDHTCYVR